MAAFRDCEKQQHPFNLMFILFYYLIFENGISSGFRGGRTGKHLPAMRMNHGLFLSPNLKSPLTAPVTRW